MTTTSERPTATEPDQPYDLNRAINEALDLGIDPSPHRIADLVFQGMPTVAYPDVIRALLGNHVREVMTRRRMRNKSGRNEDIAPEPQVEPDEETSVEPDIEFDWTPPPPDPEREVDAPPEPEPPKTRPNGKSAKNHRIREAWMKRLNESLCVDERNRTYKFLWQCTATDLRALAEARWKHGRSAIANGDEFARQAEAVEAAGVETFGDLPDEQKKSLLS